MQGPADWNPAPKELKSMCMKAAEHAEKQGVPLPKLALKHSIKSAIDADIAVTLVGMSSPEEVSCCDCQVVGTRSKCPRILYMSANCSGVEYAMGAACLGSEGYSQAAPAGCASMNGTYRL